MRQISECFNSHAMPIAPDPMPLSVRSFSSEAPKMPDTTMIKKIRRSAILYIFDVDCFMLVK